MTDEEIREAKRRAEESTPAPWHYTRGAGDAVGFLTRNHGTPADPAAFVAFAAVPRDNGVVSQREAVEQHERDAAFIAAARQDVPALCAELEFRGALLRDAAEESRAVAALEDARRECEALRAEVERLKRDAAGREAMRRIEELTRGPFVGPPNRPEFDEWRRAVQRPPDAPPIIWSGDV